MTKRDIVVIGGSAGAIKALRTLAFGLSPDLAATLFVVIHTSPTSPGLLPEILAHNGGLPARHATPDNRFEHGNIYVAPPNRHLLIDANGTMRLTHGPKENRFRPAIDPLFRSAALSFGPRVVGILLSGGLNDGVSGLLAIKAAGGIAVVQDVHDAEVPTLPRNALSHVEVDHCVPVAEMASIIKTLSQGNGVAAPSASEMDPMKKKQLAIELRQAEEKHGLENAFFELGQPSMLTCPECHGALLRMNDANLLRFRCHTGHAFTADSLLSALSERVEDALWNSIRAMEESAMLLGHMARHVTLSDDATAAEFRAASKAALARAKAVRSLLSPTDEVFEKVDHQPG